MMFPRKIYPQILKDRYRYKAAPLCKKFDFPRPFPLFLHKDGTLRDEPKHIWLNWDFSAYYDKEMTAELTRGDAFWLYWLLDGFRERIFSNLFNFFKDPELFVHRHMIGYGITTVTPEEALETMDYSYVDP